MLFNRYEPLPLNRRKFGPREIPITPNDIRALHQVYGEEVAENVRIAVQQIRQNGGVDPNVRDAIYPNDIDGHYDEPELLRTVSNFAIWFTFNHEPGNFSHLVTRID